MRRGEMVNLKRLVSAGLMAALVVGTMTVSGCSNPSSGTSGSSTSSFQGVPLVGAGATFPAPVYTQWVQSFVKVEPNAKINYQPIGSGGGIQQFTAKTVDFGATDAPVKAEEASKITGKYIEVPTCLGAVVVSYNLPDVKTPLKLDGETTAKIFLGQIKKWNDPAIAALNAGVTLPDTAIQVVHRADGSGTTKIFTSWLKNHSAEWGSKVGADKSVQWPTGQGANGNAGVAQAMKQTTGAIGYMEYQYAISTGLGFADVKAPDGSFVTPSVDSVSKAGAGLKFPIDEKTNILDSSTPGAYPLSSTTYILVYTEQTDANKAQTLVDFWTWALTKGQSEVTKLSYAPLPQTVDQEALAELGKITANGKTITASPGVK